MTTDQYQKKLTDKRKSIVDFVLNNYPPKAKEATLKVLLWNSLKKYTFLRDLETLEVHFKSALKEYKEDVKKYKEGVLK